MGLGFIRAQCFNNSHGYMEGVSIIQILDGGESTIQFTGRRKAIMDEAKLSPLSLF